MEIVLELASTRLLQGSEEGFGRKGGGYALDSVSVAIEGEQIRKSTELVFFHEGFTFVGFIFDSGENVVALDLRFDDFVGKNVIVELAAGWAPNSRKVG